MNYHSTRCSFDLVDSAQAVLNGLAPDGGLYMPEYIPHLDWQKTIAITAYAETKEQSHLIDDYIAHSQSKFKRLIQKQ